MAEAMVTARMTAEKKRAGTSVLESLGMNPSQAINRFYDYVIEKGALPFPEESVRSVHSPEEVAAAFSFVDGLCAPATGPFSTMSLKEARGLRLSDPGKIR